MSEQKMQNAINEIYRTYGDTVSIEKKGKSLLKFGRSTNLRIEDNFQTVWTLGDDVNNEVLPTTNAIDTVSSSNAGDTQTIRLEGHTVVGTGA